MNCCSMQHTHNPVRTCYTSTVIFHMVRFYWAGSMVEENCLGVLLVFAFLHVVSFVLDLSVPVGERKERGHLSQKQISKIFDDTNYINNK